MWQRLRGLQLGTCLPLGQPRRRRDAIERNESRLVVSSGPVALDLGTPCNVQSLGRFYDAELRKIRSFFRRHGPKPLLLSPLAAVRPSSAHPRHLH